MSSIVPVNGFRLSRSFSPAMGGALVRIQAIASPRFGRNESFHRTLFRIRSLTPGERRERPVAAIGAAVEGRPAILEGEIPLSPGLYDIKPIAGPAAEMRFRVPDGNGPLGVLCRHKVRNPSFTEYAVILSPLGKTMGVVVTALKSACCRRDILRYAARAENPRDLAFLQPLEGALHVRVGGDARIVSPGEYVVEDPDVRSPFDAGMPFPVRYRGVVVTQAMFRPVRERLGLGEEMGPFGFDPMPRSLPAPLRAAVESLQKAVSRSGSIGADRDALLMLEHFLIALLNAHTGRLRDLWESRVRNQPKDPRLRKAIHYLKEHLADPFSAREVGRAVAVSPPHLRALFRRHLGTSPVQYLQHLRIEAAKRLLADGDRKMEEVAREVGYADLVSLRRIFRRHAQGPLRSFR